MVRKTVLTRKYPTNSPSGHSPRRNWLSWLLKPSRTQRWRHQLESELLRMRPTDLDKTLSDVSLTRASLGAILKSRPTDTTLLQRMLQRVGLNPDRVTRTIVRDMQRTCLHCDAKRKCEKWLARVPENNSCPKFCPNATTLEKMTTPISEEVPPETNFGN